MHAHRAQYRTQVTTSEEARHTQVTTSEEAHHKYTLAIGEGARNESPKQCAAHASGLHAPLRIGEGAGSTLSRTVWVPHGAGPVRNCEGVE